MPNHPDHAALFDVLCANMVAVMNGQPVDSNEFFCRLDKQVNPRRKNYTPAEFAGMVRSACGELENVA